MSGILITGSWLPLFVFVFCHLSSWEANEPAAMECDLAQSEMSSLSKCICVEPLKYKTDRKKKKCLKVVNNTSAAEYLSRCLWLARVGENGLCKRQIAPEDETKRKWSVTGCWRAENVLLHHSSFKNRWALNSFPPSVDTGPHLCWPPGGASSLMASHPPLPKWWHSWVQRISLIFTSL